MPRPDPRLSRGSPDPARRAEFERVALPHLDRLAAYALSLARNRPDADDLVQEAYLRAWRFFGTFREGSNARAWLYRILFNVFLGGRRRAKLEPVQLPEEEGAEDLLLYDQLVREGGWKDPAELTPERFGHLFGDEVRRALDRLGPAFRFTLLLCDVDGLPYHEIAAVTRVPVGTVRSRIARARAALQRDLAGYARARGVLKGGPARRELRRALIHIEGKEG